MKVLGYGGEGDLVRYKGVTKALVVSELIAIFYFRDRKS